MRPEEGPVNSIHLMAVFELNTLLYFVSTSTINPSAKLNDKKLKCLRFCIHRNTRSVKSDARF